MSNIKDIPTPLMKLSAELDEFGQDCVRMGLMKQIGPSRFKLTKKGEKHFNDLDKEPKTNNEV